MKPLKLAVLLLFLPSVFFGQSLTGLWSGVMTNDSNTIRKDVSLEIALTEYRGKVYGYSCSEFIINDTLYYIVKRVKGTINGDVCEVKDDEIVSYNFRGKLEKGVKVIHTFRMNKGDSTWHLEGGWKTTSTKKYYSLTGTTDLKEEKDMATSKLFPHLEELSLAKDVAFYQEQKRQNQPIAQVSKPTETDAAKNLSLNKQDVTVKNKTSLTSLENTEENKPTEEKIQFAQRKTESPVATIQTETKKTNPATNNSIEIKKPTITEQNKPYVEKQEPSVAVVQPETKKTETSSVAVQSEVKKPNPTANNVVETKKDQSIVASNNTNTAIQKKEPPVMVAQSDPKKIETTTVAVQPEVKRTIPATNNAVEIKKDQPVIASNNTNTSIQNKTETPIIPVQPDIKQTQTSINKAADNKKTDSIFASAATFATERKSDKTQTVFFKSDSLELVLYDNGEVDGDTVSVLMNGVVIIPKQCLKAVAYKKTIYIPHNSNDSTVLVLYAENLGKYPPNTGLLIVHDGDDSYQVHFTADLQTNAAIILRRKNK